MIDVKQAVHQAIAFVTDMYGADQLPQLRLEEVELDEHEPFWYVTIGFDRPGAASPTEVLKGPFSRPREYKILKIHAHSGDVSSMKIREVHEQPTH